MIVDLLRCLLLTAVAVSTNPLPLTSDQSWTLAPLNSTTKLLGDRFDPVNRVTYTTRLCSPPPTSPWLLSDFFYLSLSFIGANWRNPDPDIPHRTGSFIDPVLPNKQIRWDTLYQKDVWFPDQLFKPAHMGWITFKAVETLFADFGLETLFAGPASFSVRSSNPTMSGGILAWANVVVASQSGFEQPTVSASALRNTSHIPQQRGISTESADSFVATNAEVHLSITRSSPTQTHPQLHFFASILTLLQHIIVVQWPNAKFDKRWTSNLSPIIQTQWGRSLFTVEVTDPPPRGGIAASYGDLETALRRLVLAPELVDGVVSFTAKASMMARGGVAAPFVTFRLEVADLVPTAVQSNGTMLVDRLAGVIRNQTREVVAEDFCPR